MTPRSLAIPKSWKTFNFPSFFSAFLYPALGLALLITMIVLGLALEALNLHWWYLPVGIGVVALSIFICNAGIGPMHRILQHRAGELRAPAQILTMINLMIAMQGNVRDWVNYHSQHHRFSDKPGDPHNPFESKRWTAMSCTTAPRWHTGRGPTPNPSSARAGSNPRSISTRVPERFTPRTSNSRKPDSRKARPTSRRRGRCDALRDVSDTSGPG